jgi:hypothetical protein
MAAHSVTTTPPCVSAGTLPIGLIARYSGALLFAYSTIFVVYGWPTSSSIQRAMRPRDIGLV